MAADLVPDETSVRTSIYCREITIWLYSKSFCGLWKLHFSWNSFRYCFIGIDMGLFLIALLYGRCGVRGWFVYSDVYFNIFNVLKKKVIRSDLVIRLKNLINFHYCKLGLESIQCSY